MRRVERDKGFDLERKVESDASVVSRIAECWGFYRRAVVLMELGYKDGWCDRAAFQVCGVGYSTDFRTLAMDPAYDAEDGDPR